MYKKNILPKKLPLFQILEIYSKSFVFEGIYYYFMLFKSICNRLSHKRKGSLSKSIFKVKIWIGSKVGMLKNIIHDFSKKLTINITNWQLLDMFFPSL